MDCREKIEQLEAEIRALKDENTELNSRRKQLTMKPVRVLQDISNRSITQASGQRRERSFKDESTTKRRRVNINIPLESDSL
jgi:hypothetical protein